LSSGLARVCIVTDRHATRSRPLASVVRAALEGGARLVQLREKDLEGGPLLSLCEELLVETRRFGAKLLVNERIDVAVAAGADGVVLPADSFPTAVARSLLGEGKIVGRSTHSAVEVERAVRDGCDFAFFGPVFATPSKAAFGEPQGVERLASVAKLGIPLIAIGGIDANNASRTIAAGAHGIAVIREAMSAADPKAAVERLIEAIG